MRTILTKRLRRRLRIGSSGFVLLLTLLYPGLILISRVPISPEGYAAVFDALSGTLNALVLALLIARLDSKLIGLPSWLVCILYSYAAVQPLFVVFELQSSAVLTGMKTAVLVVVFILKIYFFLIVLYTLQTGRMLNYLYCFPLLSKQVNKAELEAAAGVNSLSVNTLKVDYPKGQIADDAKGRRSHWFLSKVVGSLRSVQPLLLASYNIGIAAFSYFLFSLLGYAARGAQGNFPLNPSDIVIDAANLFFIIIAITILTRGRLVTPDQREAVRRVFKTIFNVAPSSSRDFQAFQNHSEREVKKFRKYFLYFWMAMAALYVVFALEHGLGNKYPFAYALLEFGLSSLNLLFIFWCFVILYLPAYNRQTEKRQNQIIHHSLFLVVVFIAAYPLFSFLLQHHALSNYDAVFSGAAGTLSAVAWALLIARLDSKLIGLSSWLICILLAYSAIQPLSVVFHQHPDALKTIKTSVLLVALGFKICFFLIIFHTLASGKIVQYLICFPFLNKRVDSIFENQFDIRTRRQDDFLFTFEIWKKNELAYTSNHSPATRTECDTKIKRLRELIEIEESREVDNKCLRVPQPVAGTFWVEFRDRASGLILESAPLRSKTEADDLMQQSIDNIPYCKYSRL